MKIINTSATKSIVEKIAGRIYFKTNALAFNEFLCLAALHCGTCSLGAQQRALLPTNDWGEKLLKDPPVGISPCNMLKG